MDVTGKSCLITGGTSGIGAATAAAFLRRGAKVAVMARTAKDDVFASLKKEAGGDGSRVIFLQGEAGNQADCARVVADAQTALGRVDVLVHAAGGAAPGGLLDVTEERWRNAFDVHVHSIFSLTRAAVPEMMRRREGAIILIGSAAGHRGCLGALAYGVVKGALPQFARALARELADSNVRVNCVSPGVIRTPFQNVLTAAQVKNNIDNRIPLHREGTPEEVAQAIVALVENDFITGQDLVIDGGMSMRMV